jgi:ribonuclease P protein component
MGPNPRDCRIRQRAQFQRIYQHGLRIRGRYSTVFFLANTTGFARLGIAATRKIGGSVQRNRAKRLVRELFRHNRVDAGIDIVVVPKREFLGIELAVLEVDYRNCLERRLPRPR